MNADGTSTSADNTFTTHEDGGDGETGSGHAFGADTLVTLKLVRGPGPGGARRCESRTATLSR